MLYHLLKKQFVMQNTVTICKYYNEIVAAG